MAGYSGTPLVWKLGIKSGFNLAFVNAPRDFARHLDLPANVTINLKTRKPLEFALLFVKREKGTYCWVFRVRCEANPFRNALGLVAKEEFWSDYRFVGNKGSNN